MEKLEIVVLTKSYKNGGFCVAGINVNTGKWVRLVTEEKKLVTPLQDKDMLLTNGNICKILDVVSVPVIKPTIYLQYQPENCVIIPNSPWDLLKSVTLNDVLQKIHPIENYKNFIFGNNCSFLTKDNIVGIDYSLTIVEVNNFETYKNKYNKYKAKFEYNNNQYIEFSITDPDYINKNVNYSKAYLIISIPGTPHSNENFKNRYYKFIAKIFIKK